MNFIWAKMEKKTFLPMNVKRRYHLSVDAAEGFFRANEVYFSVNESIQ